MNQPIEPVTQALLSSKARLLAHASTHVKAHGFAASPVDALAKQAGMTSGAVYQHFAGKADLFAAVIDAELQKTSQRFSHIAAHDVAAAEKALNKYVNQAHVEHPEVGCPLPSLTAEVARASDAVKLAYQNGLLDIHQQLSRITGSPQAAWTLLAQSVGSVMLARAMSNSALQSDLLSAVKAHSLSLLNDGLPESAA
jgi:TetR/AcrR family transcriptional regulator, transcriptional repressor for nem operon